MLSCRHAVLFSCFHAVMSSCCTNHFVGCPCKSDDSTKLVLPFRIFQTPFFPKLHTSLEPLSSSLSSLSLSFFFSASLLKASLLHLLTGRRMPSEYHRHHLGSALMHPTSFQSIPVLPVKLSPLIHPRTPTQLNSISSQSPLLTVPVVLHSSHQTVEFHHLSVATAHRASRLAQLPSNS